MIVRCGTCLGTGQRHAASCSAAGRRNKTGARPAVADFQNRTALPENRPAGCTCVPTICEACGGMGQRYQKERYEVEDW